MELKLWENLGDVSLDSELPSFSLSVLMAGKIDGMEIGESGFVPFLIKLKLPDSELADGKTEYSTSDSLLSSLTVLPRCELLATNSATKNYEIQKCLKLKLYSIQSLQFSCLTQNSLKLTWINLVLPHTDIGQKIFGRLRAKKLHMKNLEASAKILSHVLSCSFPLDWLDQGPSSLSRRGSFLVLNNILVATMCVW